MAIFNFKNFMLLSAVAAATVAATAQAQNSASGDVATLEEIVVTAQRRNESLQDVPIAITVATKEQIERDQIYSLTDLQRVTPALEVSQTFGGESTGGGRIRGVGTNVFNQTATGSVAVVVDQVPQGLMPFAQLYDLAQVEVLRGPQGTLFGQTASAGVINVNTVAPDPSKFSARVGVDYANNDSLGSEFGQTVFNGAVNMPISGNSALRLTAFYKGETGVQRNVYLNRDNKIDVTSFRARYLLKPSDAWTINLIAEHNTDDRDGVNFFVQAKAPTNPASLGLQTACGVSILESAQQYCTARQPKEEIANYGLSSIIEWQAPNFAVTSVTGYRNKDRKRFYLDFTRAVGVPLASDQRGNDLSNQISQELRIASTGNSKLNYVAGVFYSKFEYEYRPLENLPFGVPSAPVGFSVCTFTGTFCPVQPSFVFNDTTVKAQSVFGDLTYGFTEAWTGFAGLRYTNQESSALVGANNNPRRRLGLTNSNVSGRLGFRWRANGQMMVYGSVSRGFKAGLVEVPGDALAAPFTLRPEIPTSYEVGAKWSLLDDRLAVDANVFHNTVKDYHTQTSFFPPGGTNLVSVSTNIPELVSKGLEVDVIGRLSNSLSFTAGYIYNPIKYPAGFLGDDGGTLGGEQVLSAPLHKLALSGEYVRSLASGLRGYLNLNAVYKSDLRLSPRGGVGAPANQLGKYVYPSHTTIGASIGVKSANDRWSAALFGRNLTGEREPIGYLANTFAGALDGGVRAWPDGGVTLKQVGLKVEYKY
jgi:outer membrane receptor protein involved in Fe transport